MEKSPDRRKVLKCSSIGIASATFGTTQDARANVAKVYDGVIEDRYDLIHCNTCCGQGGSFRQILFETRDEDNRRKVEDWRFMGDKIVLRNPRTGMYEVLFHDYQYRINPETYMHDFRIALRKVVAPHRICTRTLHDPEVSNVQFHPKSKRRRLTGSFNEKSYSD